MGWNSLKDSGSKKWKYAKYSQVFLQFEISWQPTDVAQILLKLIFIRMKIRKYYGHMYTFFVVSIFYSYFSVSYLPIQLDNAFKTREHEFFATDVFYMQKYLDPVLTIFEMKKLCSLLF